MAPRRTDAGEVVRRVERCLVRCLELSQEGRFRQVLREVERVLPAAAGDAALEAQLQVWKAQALLSMGLLERAVSAAERSWTLDPSAHACHVLASVLYRSGAADEAEERLRDGLARYPEAEHLALQLAVALADQGRVPEALDLVEELRLAELGEELQVFARGLHANLLAACGRWGEAETVLREALRRHPEAPALLHTRDEIAASSRRLEAEQALAASWREALAAPLEGTSAEVEDAVVRLASTLEVTPLQALSARRLWRAVAQTDRVRPTAHDAWAAAVLGAVLELDGEPVPAAALARACAASPATVRAALQRIRAWMAQRDPELARRAFATTTNPRLEEPANARSGGNVVPFRARGDEP